MRRFAWALCAVLVLAAVSPVPGIAHTRSETHSAGQVRGASVHLQFTVPDLESRRIDPAGELPAVDTLGRYIAEHVGAFSGDAACQPTEGPRPIAATPGYRR